MRIPLYFINWLFVLLLTVICDSVSYSQTPLNNASLDVNILNEHILEEVNKLRKKAKVLPLQNETALAFASDDHAKYMLSNQKLTHKQRIRIKRTPKNRVDFYGQQFNLVGENVQLNNLNLNSNPKDKKHPTIDTYEKLAEQLVLSWENSPPHYANMVKADFVTTYTNIAIGENGEIYACQLFGGSKYEDRYKEQRDTVEFKPDRAWRCWRCKIRPPLGSIEITEDSTIVYSYYPPNFYGIVIPAIFRTRMRFFNPWRDGLAADIIVKSQYPCDSNTYHNGLSNFRGIPLPPVYRKDFHWGIRYAYTEIVLGKVPSYIKEDFEVNLVVIQNKRPCSNEMFHVIPSEFHVDIPLSYGFDPVVTKMKCHKIDTLYSRMYFNKAMITPKDSTLTDIIELVKINQGHITSLEINGYASIEGSKEGNIELYKKRTEYLLEELLTLGTDSSSVKVKTSENFVDFRKDIKNTKYSYLDTLSDIALKEKIQDRELSQELEFLLKNHRYVDLQIITRYDYELEYDRDLANNQLDEAIDKESISKSILLQQIQYGLALAGKMTMEEIESVVIPVEKKNVRLLHNRAVMKFNMKPVTVESLLEFRAELWKLRDLKKVDERLNTSIAIIDYHLYSMGKYYHKKITFYDSIQKWANLDKVQQARILLNAASIHDWNYFMWTGSHKEKKYWYKKVKRYVATANLDVDKTFEIASYYQFFWQNRYAHDLTSKIIDETKNPHDLILFLKLIHLTGLKLPRKTYLKYFKKIKEYSGEEFCTFFNSPELNFQIFDDEEIKKIYCEECAGR